MIKAVIFDCFGVLSGDGPNEELFEFIKTLATNYKIGMLSNVNSNMLDDSFTPEQMALFDEVVLSYQLGTVKPDPLMYQTIANKLGVLPEECVFVDDLEHYASAAGNLGMQYIHFTDTKQAIAELEEILNA